MATIEELFAEVVREEGVEIEGITLDSAAARSLLEVVDIFIDDLVSLSLISLTLWWCKKANVGGRKDDGELN